MSSDPPEIKSTKPNLDLFRPFTVVIVEVAEDDLVDLSEWETGFYHLPLLPQEIRRRLNEG